MPTSDVILALQVALEAGELLMKYLGKANIDSKGDKNLVTDADHAAEQLITERLTTARPNDSVVAEEGTYVKRDAARRWIVDPLDGTNNFAHGFIAFAVSIALEVNGEITAGVVHAPALGKTFSARKGAGATLNGQSISVSKIDRISEAICATGFPYARKTMKQNNLAEFSRVALEVQGIRRVGSASLDLCWVASGRWDGYWEAALQPWDIAAGMLICQEAGGKVTDYRGGAVNLDEPQIVATNGLIQGELLSLINRET